MIYFTESKFEPMMSDHLRYKPPGRCFMQNTGRVVVMTSEELLKKLQECHNISVDKKTVYNYATKYGWIPEPRVINKGRAGGKIIDYDESASIEFVASYRLKREKRVSREDVALARGVALKTALPLEMKSEKGIDYYVNIMNISHDWQRLLEEAKEAEDPKRRKYNELRIQLLNGGPSEELEQLFEESIVLGDKKEQAVDQYFIEAVSMSKRNASQDEKKALHESLWRTANEIDEKLKAIDSRIKAINDEIDAKAYREIYGPQE